MLLKKEENKSHGSVTLTDYATLPVRQRDSICRRILELIAEHHFLTVDQLKTLLGINDQVVAAYLDIMEYYDLIVFVKVEELPGYRLNEACEITENLRRAVKI